MDAIMILCGILIFFLANLKHLSNAQSSFENQMFFKKMYDHGDSLKLEEVLFSHRVDSQVDCSLKCLEEGICVGYNFRSKANKNEINCQTSRNTTLERGKDIVHGEWIFYQNLETLAVYGEWTLIARFSNGDSKHWIDNSAFWYDRVTPYGEVDNPLGNTDMISSSFWEKKGSEIRITRSDDPSNTALLQTTSNCLRGATFRSKITSYGNFRGSVVWANNRCRGSCPVSYGGQYQTTAGFEQHSCSSDIQSSGFIGFWCDWMSGDGAVMMIGGGGRDCERADHGIGITEKDAAGFGANLRPTHDFGSRPVNASRAPSIYSLNLWVR